MSLLSAANRQHSLFARSAISIPNNGYFNDPFAAASEQSYFMSSGFDAAKKHTGHPSFAHLMLLVLEAVLEVVCVSLPGYIVARVGMFSAENQKFVANLNVMLFTPCLSRLYIYGRLKIIILTFSISFYQARIATDDGKDG
jgi:hypothetical protein